MINITADEFINNLIDNISANSESYYYVRQPDYYGIISILSIPNIAHYDFGCDDVYIYANCKPILDVRSGTGNVIETFHSMMKALFPEHYKIK